jgi:tRNA modification GTPase
LPQGNFRFQWKPHSQRIYYGTAVDGDGQVIDEVLCLAMLKPKSYTREDVLELHTHGGGVCAQRVLRAIVEAGARPARPGEFTLRAFLNGRLDLSQVW